jgi:hypothetical protein
MNRPIDLLLLTPPARRAPKRGWRRWVRWQLVLWGLV